MNNEANGDYADIDLLIIGDKVREDLPKHIIDVLKPYGIVLFHPDFYTKRPRNAVLFEIIVLPSGSRWLISPIGRLIGLSIFQHGNYRFFPQAVDIQKYVPIPPKPRSLHERLRIVLCSYSGLMDIYAKLWAITWNYAASSKSPYVDIRRIIKWVICDSVWVLTGRFFFDKDTLIKKFYEYFPKVSKQYEALITNLIIEGHIDENINIFKEACQLTWKLITELKNSSKDSFSFPFWEKLFM